MTDSTLSVLHTVAGIYADRGGPSRSIPALCEAIAGAGTATTLVTRLDHPEAPRPEGAGFTLRLAPPGVPAYARAVREEAERAQIVHDHGLWLASNVATGWAAIRSGRRLAVSVRGMLETEALSRKPLKKRVAWYLYQKALLAHAALLHATSDREVESIRRAGLRAPVALIPNGVRVPDTLPPRTTGTRRRALFLSRLHPIKGLPLLVDAWATVRPPGWELVLAGPDEGGHRADIERQVAEQGLADVVHFVGAVGDDEKWSLYRSADLVVLPTRGENFGLVIAEALGAGVPVLTTTGAPWPIVRERAFGWWVAPTVAALAAALADATSRPAADLVGRGARGRAYVLDTLGWPSIGARMADAYRWTLTGGSPPPDLHL